MAYYYMMLHRSTGIPICLVQESDFKIGTNMDYWSMWYCHYFT